MDIRLRPKKVLILVSLFGVFFVLDNIILRKSNNSYLEYVDIHIHNFQDTNLSRFEVGKSTLQFLPNFKNPCILEHIEDNNNWVYEKNKFILYPKLKSREGNILLNAVKNFSKGILMESNSNTSPCKPNQQCRIRCLPYFQLLGVAKCGTSDFYARAISHPYIFGAAKKELFFWSQYRFQINATIGDYMDLFDSSVPELLQKTRVDESGKTYYPAVLSEYTSAEFMDDVFWRENPLNSGLLEPKYTKAHDLYAVNPNTKFIVLLRNPTSRLYSSYNFFKRRFANVSDFHSRVVSSIQWWKNCTEMLGLPRRRCAYGCPPEMPSLVCVRVQGASNNRWQGSTGNYSGEIRRGLYSISAKDWLSVYPRNQMLFLRTEDNANNMLQTFNNIVLPFLGLEKVNEIDPDVVNTVGSDVLKHKQYYEPMLPETKQLLDDFYRPFNEELAEILGDSKWLWQD